MEMMPLLVASLIEATCLSADLSYRVSPKSANKCGKYGQKLI